MISEAQISRDSPFPAMAETGRGAAASFGALGAASSAAGTGVGGGPDLGLGSGLTWWKSESSLALEASFALRNVV